MWILIRNLIRIQLDSRNWAETGEGGGSKYDLIRMKGGPGLC